MSTYPIHAMSVFHIFSSQHADSIPTISANRNKPCHVGSAHQFYTIFFPTISHRCTLSCQIELLGKSYQIFSTNLSIPARTLSACRLSLGRDELVLHSPFLHSKSDLPCSTTLPNPYQCAFSTLVDGSFQLDSACLSRSRRHAFPIQISSLQYIISGRLQSSQQTYPNRLHSGR